MSASNSRRGPRHQASATPSRMPARSRSASTARAALPSPGRGHRHRVGRRRPGLPPQVLAGRDDPLLGAVELRRQPSPAARVGPVEAVLPEKFERAVGVEQPDRDRGRLEPRPAELVGERADELAAVPGARGRRHRERLLGRLQPLTGLEPLPRAEPFRRRSLIGRPRPRGRRGLAASAAAPAAAPPPPSRSAGCPPRRPCPRAAGPPPPATAPAAPSARPWPSRRPPPPAPRPAPRPARAAAAR